MKKAINTKLTKALDFFQRLINNEATAIEAYMFGIGIIVVVFAIIWAFKPEVPNIR